MRTHQALLNSGFKTISEQAAREAGLSICGGVDRDIPEEMTNQGWMEQAFEVGSCGTTLGGARNLAFTCGKPPDRIFDQPSKKDLG
ncbi:MAG: hypothetical protein ABIH38_02685 [Patescibacteria group bacterium]